MNVYGELKKAQLENIASTTTTPAATGRMYMDVTAPTAAIPMIYNGTSWRPLSMGQSSAVIASNSGSAVTVDWSLGLFQQVTLTANSVISFSNPVSGSIHTLIVQQASGGSVYSYSLNMTDQDTRNGSYQPVGVLPTNRNQVHSWFYKATVRVAYATVPSATMATLSTTLATGIAIAPNGKHAMAGRTSFPFIEPFRLNDVPLLNQSPFGSNAFTTSLLVAQTLGVCYTPDSRTIFTVSGTSPYIQACSVNEDGMIISSPIVGELQVDTYAGYGATNTKIPYFTNATVNKGNSIFSVTNDSSTAGGGLQITFSRAATVTASIDFYTTAGEQLGISHNSAALTTAVYSIPMVTRKAYAQCMNATAYTGSASTEFQVAAGDVVRPHTSGAVPADAASCQFRLTAIANVTNFTNPGVLPTGAGQSIAIHPNGMFVGVGHTTSPFMSIYPWTGNAFGTKLSNPSSLPAAAVTGLAFSPTGDYLAAVSQTTPFIQVWAFTGVTGTGTIGAVSSNPANLPAAGAAGQLGKPIAWRPQGDYIAMAMTSSPYLYVVPFTRSTGVFGTRLTITALSGAATCVQWTPDGQYLIVGTGTTPYLYVFDFSAATVGTAIALDGSNPGVQVNDISVHPSGDWMALALNASPYNIGYSLPTKARNYLRIID